MKTRKTITDAVRAANRANARCSTGPRTEKGKSTSRYNALKHGILATKVVLASDEDREEFQKLSQLCNSEFKPRGLLENFLVEEIESTFWKLGVAMNLETRELVRRQDVQDEALGVFRELELPVSDWDLPLDRGWDCDKIVIRAGAGNDKRNFSASRGPAVCEGQVVSGAQQSHNAQHQETGHLEVQAVLGRSLGNVVRYQSALKRYLYPAIEMLRKLQAERIEKENRAKKSLA